MAKRERRRRSAERAARRSSSPPPPPPGLLSEYWRPIISIVVIVAFGIVVVWAITHADLGDDNGTDKELAPTYALQDIDGELISSDLFKGRVVILDLFATWCSPCREQILELNELRNLYPETVLTIISVDVDPGETPEQVRSFRDEHGARWYFALDTDDLSTKYDASSIPTMVIIDKDGYLVWRHQGVTRLDDLHQLIEPLLAGA